MPAEREAARAAMRPGRTVPILAVVVLLAAAVGGLLGWVSDQVSTAPALWLSLLILFLLWYAVRPMHAGPILGWAGRRTLGSVRMLVPMASRGLPLLLVFVTFLFINAEAWQLTSNLPFGLLWLVCVLLLRPGGALPAGAAARGGRPRRRRGRRAGRGARVPRHPARGSRAASWPTTPTSTSPTTPRSPATTAPT